MRKFFLTTAVLLLATAAHAGPNLAVASADAPPSVPSPAAPSPAVASPAASNPAQPDAAALAAKRQAMMQQKMAMQKQKQMAMQMAMQREMALHPIRTRVHFALVKIRRTLDDAF
jgi:hypothetical protein